jgi:hypothetical protein
MAWHDPEPLLYTTSGIVKGVEKEREHVPDEVQ